MRTRHLLALIAFLTAASGAYAQKWEFGGMGGWGYYKNTSLSGGKADAKAGFAAGLAAGVFLGNNMYRHLGGEFRYTFQKNDLQVSSGGTKVNFGGRAHAIHYDFLLHATPSGARVRPFVAFGGGIKLYEGTGTEAAVQPLSSYAILTKTRQVTGLISLGGGVKVALSKRVLFRLEVKDYLTRFPTEVVTPVPPVKAGGWLHNIVPMVSLAMAW